MQRLEHKMIEPEKKHVHMTANSKQRFSLAAYIVLIYYMMMMMMMLQHHLPFISYRNGEKNEDEIIHLTVHT